MAPRTARSVFRDRGEAGRILAESVRSLDLEDPVVLGLPRGGVPVAFAVARALRAPLDVLVARKIGAPGRAELAIGAVSEGGVRVLDHRAIAALLVGHEELEHAIARASWELDDRVARYRRFRQAVPVEGRDAIVVDDGLATGATARAALRAVRERHPRRVVLAVPVGSRQAVESLSGEADAVVCVLVPDDLRAIGFFYRDFGQTSDDQVAELLTLAAQLRPAGVNAEPDPPVKRSVTMPFTPPA
jgi:putative phosphoribosyl transferase